MGTHPIFESNFDCLTEHRKMASRVQGGAAARPWWHNPDLDMPVEDIATFYREHTQKLSRLQKQKEKEKKKDVKRKQRKQRKRERGEDTSSSSSGSSTSGSEDYDSDMEPDGLDLTKNLMPLTHYPTRREILDNCFNIIRGDVMKKMVPEQLRDIPEGDLKEKLASQMDGLSRKRINHILQYGVDMDFSSGESDVDSEEEVENAKKAQKEAEKRAKRGPIQSSQIDSTDVDLVVPAIEDLDSMTLEQITELREKIRNKVDKAHEEEQVSQAKQQEQDDDYEYMWEEADPEEEEAKKVDEIVTEAKPQVVKRESSSEEEDESSDDSDSDEEMSEQQLRLRAKALALARAKIAAAKRAKAEKEKMEKEQPKGEDKEDEDSDSDVSVNRDEETNEETALVPVQQSDDEKMDEVPEFEYAAGVAANPADEQYVRRSPTPPPEPEKTTEELQEDLQSELKSRALKSMKKRKLAKLKEKAQAVDESSDDDDGDDSDEPMDQAEVSVAAADDVENAEKPQFRSGYGSDEEK